jgi:hypothetical protein
VRRDAVSPKLVSGCMVFPPCENIIGLWSTREGAGVLSTGGLDWQAAYTSGMIGYR